MAETTQSTTVAAPEPSLERVRRVALVVLVNISLTIAGWLVILGLPLGANFTPIRAETVRVWPDDSWTMAPGLVEVPYQNSQPVEGTPVETILLSTNSLGFRDREWSREKPPGVFRIAFFGDSFVFGVGVDGRDTITKHLQDALDEVRPGRFEVMNFGIPGINLEGMGRMTERYGVAFSPDLVLYSFISDDVSTVDSTSLAAWRDRLPAPVAERMEGTLAAFKQFRYTMDYRVLSSLPPLYRKRVGIVLDYLTQVADRHGHDLALVDYDDVAPMREAVARVNHGRERPVEVVSDFKYEPGPDRAHPNASSNHALARHMRDVVLRIEQRRSAGR